MLVWGNHKLAEAIAKKRSGGAVHESSKTDFESGDLARLLRWLITASERRSNSPLGARVYSVSTSRASARAGTARKDTCKLVLTGRHLLYDVTLDGGWIFLSLSLMDKGDPPDNLVTLGDGPEGWHTLAQLISAFERHNVKSLARPIEFGNSGGPGGWAIA